MIGHRLEIRGTLEVLTPLHVGNGERREVTRDDGKTGSIRAVEVDADCKPFLPGSSMKGVLRDAIHEDEAKARLFGPSRIDGGDDAHSGRILFRNAWFQDGPPERIARRAADRKVKALHGAIMVETHVAKNADAGVAERAKLFQDDIVLPGTTFTLSLSLFDRDDADLADLNNLLSMLARKEGVPFGRAGRQGMGRVRLLPDSVTSTREPGKKPSGLPPVKSAADRVGDIRLRLISPAPFLIHDPHRAPPMAQNSDPQRNNTLLALQNFEGQGARLTGSTLLGALRARFDDFARRAGKGEAIERLFGTSDRRGRVSILSLACQSACKTDPLSASKIDPPYAARDQGLSRRN